MASLPHIGRQLEFSEFFHGQCYTFAKFHEGTTYNSFSVILLADKPTNQTVNIASPAQLAKVGDTQQENVW